MPLPRLTGQVVAFSRFWLAREAGLLIADGTVVELAARPFAVLAALIDANGRVVSAAELRDIVWNGVNVDANTVQAQISAIRRALDEERDLIVTMPGRGYRFAGEIREVTPPDTGSDAARNESSGHAETLFSPDDALTPSASGSTTSLPAARIHGDEGPGTIQGGSLSPFIGRHAELSELLAVVPVHRLVTLTGAPGIGKTRLASEAASRLASHFADGTFYVELAPLGQPERIANVIGAALGFEPNSHFGEPATLAAHIGGRQMLVVIDHCDHLGEAAGQAIDALVSSTPALHVIVTSEAPLFIAGELAVPLAPLRVPHEAIDDTAPFAYDALQLLFARLSPAFHRAERTSRDVPDAPAPDPATVRAAASVCRRVDGVPLAIELAAAAIVARAAAGTGIDPAIASFAGELDALVTRRNGARRAVLPRPEIVRTVLELSCAQLDDTARRALRRLGIFPGTFSRAAALDVLDAFETSHEGKAAPDRCANEQALCMLIRFELVAANDCDGPRLQLPHAVRRFALDALDRHRETHAAAACLAGHVARDVALLTHGDTRLHLDIDALRAALEWTIGADKTELCADLLEHSAPLWFGLSFFDEYVDWIRAALVRADATPIRRIRDEMRLRAILARALAPIRGAADEIVRNWERTYQLATVCADTPHRLRALFCLVMSALEAGEVERGLQLSAEFSEIAAIARSPAAELNARRVEGIVKAYHGEIDDALRLLAPLSGPGPLRAGGTEDADLTDPETIHEANAMATSFGLSLHLVGSAILAATRWFAGEPHSVAPLYAALRNPRSEGEPLAHSISLALACSLAVLDDDTALAESCAASLVTCARLGGLRRWLRAGLDAQLWLDARQGDHDAARRLLGGAARRIARARISLLDVAFIATLLPRTPLEHDTQLAASLGLAIRAALQRAERVGEYWHTPELLRIDAALRLATGDDPRVVQALLADALARAHRYRAHRIALRVTVDLETLDTSARGSLFRIR